MPGHLSRGQDLASSRVGWTLSPETQWLVKLQGAWSGSQSCRQITQERDVTGRGFFYLLALEMPGASTHIREGPTLDRDPQQILDIHKMNQCPVDQGQSSDFPECHLTFLGRTKGPHPCLHQLIHVMRRDRTNSL